LARLGGAEWGRHPSLSLKYGLHDTHIDPSLLDWGDAFSLPKAETCNMQEPLEFGGPAGLELASGDVSLQEQVLRLTQEKRELKDYAERITRELRRYQQARPSPAPQAEDELPLPPWATNMQMMSPLLFAYEERIAELEAVVERSVSLAEQAQLLTKENDALRAELQERTEQLRNLQLVTPLQDFVAKDGDEAQELQQLYKLSVEQNEALAQQNQLLKLQVERMQHALSSTHHQAQQLQVQYQHGVQAQAKDRDRVDTLARQRSAAERRLEEVTGELVEEVRAREHLQGEVDSLNQEVHLQGQSLTFYKKSYEDRCTSASDEEGRLQAELERIADSERSLKHRLGSLEQELAEVTEHLFASRRENESTKQEAEQILRLMESIEARLKDISARHEKAQRELNDKDRMLGDLQMQRDGWGTSEQTLKRQIERLEGRLSTELDAAKRQREVECANLQDSHRRILSEMDEKLRKSDKFTTQLESKVELLERQKNWEAAAYERQNASLATDKERWQHDMESLQQDRLRLDKQAESSRKEMARVRDELEAAVAASRESAARNSTELLAAQAKAQSEERALQWVRDELRTSEQRASAFTSERERLKSEVLEERARVSEVVERERQQLVQERRNFERQMQHLQARARQGEQRAIELLRAQEALRQRLQDELTLEKEALQSQIERFRRENRSLKEKGRGALKALAQLRAAERGGDALAVM